MIFKFGQSAALNCIVGATLAVAPTALNVTVVPSQLTIAPTTLYNLLQKFIFNPQRRII
jgi:hypothetical protein